YVKNKMDSENDSGSGITNDEADKILDSFSKEEIKKLEILAKMSYDIIEQTRRNYEKFGVLSKNDVENLRKNFTNYVPLKGFVEEDLETNEEGEMMRERVGGKKLSAQKKVFNQILGRYTKAGSPFNNIIQQHVQSIIDGRKNEVAKSILELAKSDKTIASVHTDEKPYVNPRGKKENMNTDDYVLVKVKGQNFYVKFKSKYISRQINAANVAKTAAWVRYLNVFTRYLSQTMTSFSPEFVVTNFVRDFETAYMNQIAEQDISTTSIKGKNLWKETVKNVIPSMKSIFAVERGGNTKNKKVDKYYKEFLEDGAKTGFFYGKTTEEIGKDVEKIIKYAQADTFSKETAKKGLEATFNFVEDINTSVENAMRLASYISARENGVSRKDAAQFAKELTVNFNRQGAAGATANALFLFFNASVQGSARLSKALITLKKTVGDDGKTKYGLNRAQKIAGLVAASSFALSIINQYRSDDDEDGVSFYDKIPEYEKERNLIIMKPNGKDHWKIPLPYGYNIISNSGTIAAEVSTGSRELGDGIGFMVSSVMGSFSPVSFSKSNDLSTQTIKTITPTALKPIVELAVNENYFSSSIYNESRFGDPRPKSELGRKTTPEVYKTLSSFINEFTGGSKYVSGDVDIQPEKFKHFFDFLVGGTGRFVSRTTESIGAAIDEVKEVEARKVPFYRLFVGEPSKYYDTQKYYDNKIKVIQYYEEYKNTPISQRRDKKFKGVARLNDKMKSVDKILKQIREKRTILQKRNTPENNLKTVEKIKKLDKKEKSYISSFNKMYNDNRK
ncbi:MAG: LPD38 domain-containing protein, partial [Promethearchaeota archaeon]